MLWPVVVAGTAFLFTLLVAMSDLQFAVRSGEGRIFLETAQMIVAGLVAYLMFGRVRRTKLQRDLLIASAFSIFTLAGGVFIAIRLGGALEKGSRLERVAIWAPLFARTAGILALAFAGLIGTERRIRSVSVRTSLLSAGALVGACLLGAAVWSAQLPSGIADELLLDARRVPGTAAPFALQAFQIALIVLYLIAGVSLMRSAEQANDSFQIYLSAGCVAAGFARLNYYLYPSIYTDVVHVGDLLRLAFFVILLVGAAVEINRYWHVEAEAAVHRERERFARELHDGLTQELSFIRSQTTAMNQGTSYPEMAELIAESAGRALTEARSLLVTMRGDTSVPVRIALATEARRAAGVKASVSVDAERGILLTPSMSHELGRIVAEATSNAVRHGEATAVDIVVSRVGDRLRLAIADNGCGFDAGDTTSVQFGLRGIRERAEMLGGSASIRSTPGVGVTLEVEVPQHGSNGGVPRRRWSVAGLLRPRRVV